MYIKVSLPWSSIFEINYSTTYYSIAKSILFNGFICLLIIKSCVTEEGVDNVTVIEPDIKYTTDYSLYNDTLDNLTESDISYVDNQTSSNESNFDVATELESTISVTEDSDDSFQSQWKQAVFITPDEEICNCDLLLNICDINCCCDPDCSDEDKQVFSKCSHQVLTADENYCYQKDIIFRNNTVYKMIKNPNNAMFCIVHDNFKHHLRFKDMPILLSHRDLSSVLNYKYKTTYSWDAESDDTSEYSEIKAGNPIFIDDLKKNISDHWNLPSSCLSDICSCQEDVLYLKDFKSSCSYIVDLEKECVGNEILSGEKFLNFCVNSRSAPDHLTNNIANLILHSKTVVANASDNEFYFSQLCVNKSVLKPRKWNKACENIIRSINFAVEHDGINGINKITANFKYINVSFDISMVTQTYSVNFIWSNVSDIERKSGNPGYQIGLPILASVNGSAIGSEDLFMEQSNLSIFDQDINSFCNMNRRTIKFGKNLKGGCYLQNNFTNCKNLRNRIFEILLGPNRKEFSVGIFGNANISNTNDWIEVYHEGFEIPESNEKCLAWLGLKINILYAAVGSIANPQYKIVGIEYKYKKPEFVDLSCFQTCSDIVLTTSVVFLDVTLPAVQHYAKVPSIKANLPGDFFYPFLYGQGVKNVENLYVVVFLYFLMNVL